MKRLSITAPRSALPGERLSLEVTSSLRGVVVRLVGRDRVGRGRARRIEEVVSVPAKVVTRGRSNECVLDLPEDLVPTYAGVDAFTEYAIEAVAGSGREQAEVPISIWQRQLPPGAPEPLVVFSEPPGLELGLSSRTAQSGGVLALNVATSLAPAALELWLESRQTVRGERTTITRHRLELSPVVRLPNVVPSSASRLWSLSHELVLRARRPLGKAAVLRVPLTLLASTATAAEAPAPAVGHERERVERRLVAERVGMESDGDELWARAGEVGVRVTQRGEKLLATLELPALGLGLRKAPNGASGREPEQARAFWRAWREPIEAWAGELLSRARVLVLTDECLVLELAGTSELSLFAEVALTLARRVPTARAAIPLPRAARPAEAEWRALADELGAPLDTARLSIRGAIEGHAVEVSIERDIDGAPLHVRVALLPDESLRLTRDDLCLLLPPALHAPARVREAIARLREVAESARRRAGPYR